jgi:Flp pilus assembly protein TadG
MRFLHPNRSRRAIAAVELALLAPVLFTLLVGLWEVGRVIMIQNLLSNAARDGARLAASGAYFSSDNHISPTPPNPTVTLLAPSKNIDYELQKKVLLNLQLAGVNTTGTSVTVTNTGSSASPKTWSSTYSQGGTGSGSGYDPTAVADQLDALSITVNLPYQNVGWSPLGWFFSSGTMLSGSANWSSIRDIPLSISTIIPSQPLQPTDPLP